MLLIDYSSENYIMNLHSIEYSFHIIKKSDKNQIKNDSDTLSKVGFIFNSIYS
jgi:hypothetical protein